MRVFAIGCMAAATIIFNISVAYGQTAGSNRIPEAVTFSVGDVANFEPFGRQIINPPFGKPNLPNDVYQLSQSSNFGSASVGDLFVGSPANSSPPYTRRNVRPNGQNVDIAGPGGLAFPGPNALFGGTLPSFFLRGLVIGDNVSDISFGLDGTGSSPTQLLFSVDVDAQGMAGTSVRSEAVAVRAGGDIFATGEFAPFGQRVGTPLVEPLDNIGHNLLILRGSALGLAEGAEKSQLSGSELHEDDLDALEATDPFNNGAPPFGVRRGNDIADGFYFTLDPFSPNVIFGTISSADILFSMGSETAAFEISRPFGTLGLVKEDIVDALALDVRTNTALFSLAPDSPSLGALYSAADVFITRFDNSFSPYARYYELGLLFNDNVDALDTLAIIPEPPTAVLIVIGASFFILLLGSKQNRFNRHYFIQRILTFISAFLFSTITMATEPTRVDIGSIEFEPSIAVNPTDPTGQTLLMGFMAPGPDDKLSTRIGSTDGGTTWGAASRVNIRGSFIPSGDPSVAYNSLGSRYYCHVGTKNDLPKLIVVNRLDMMPTDIPVALETDMRALVDKPYMDIDKASSISKDFIYVSFSRFLLKDPNLPNTPSNLAGNDIMISRSTDRGAIYQRPIAINNTNFKYRTASVPAAAKDNKVYVAWMEVPISNGIIDWANGSIEINASEDAGKTFMRGSTTVATVFLQDSSTPIGHGTMLQVPSFPSLAVDNTSAPSSGKVYVVWAGRNADDKLDIFFTTSPAGPPFAFTPPKKINMEKEDTDQFFPWAAVNRSGHVAIVYYDKLNNVDDTARVMALYSVNEGVTFKQIQISSETAPPIHLDVMAESLGVPTRKLLGDYIGLASGMNTDRFFAAWPQDARGPNGEPQADLFTTSFTDPP